MGSEKAVILAFLQSHKLCVISTIGDDRPQSALVAFNEDGNLNLYFQTNEGSRKAANIQKNPSVSFVIGHNAEELATLQYEGSAQVITDPAEITASKQRFIHKDSPGVHMMEKPGATFYKVTPTWIRFSDYKTQPPVVELTDFV